MSPTLRTRLILILLPVLGALWLYTAVDSYFDTRTEVKELYDNQLELAGRELLILALATKPHLQILPNGSLLGHPHDDQLIYQVWEDNNLLVEKSINSPNSPLTKSTSGFNEVRLNGSMWRVFAIQTESGNTRVLIGAPSDLLESEANIVALRNLIPLAVSLPLLALMMWWGMAHSMAQLSRLAEETQKRTPGNLTPIEEKSIPTSARPLAQSLNILFSHLKTAFNMERRFTSDAAHELRTPLAALKTHAEVALQAKDEDEQQQALRQVVRGVNRASRLVEQLLTLARLDPETGLTDVRRTDIFIIAESVISDEAPIAFEKNIEIGLSGTRGKFVNGSNDAISVLIRNLVDNAIRYTPNNGEVEVIVDQDDENHEIILGVADNGPGIPEEDRDRVFKRFFRRLGNISPGSGLGLSIVTRIADLHDASIRLDTSHLGGLLVEVRFKNADTHTPRSAR